MLRQEDTRTLSVDEDDDGRVGNGGGGGGDVGFERENEADARLADLIDDVLSNDKIIHPSVKGLQSLLAAMRNNPSFGGHDLSLVANTILTNGKILEEQMQLRRDAAVRDDIVQRFADEFHLTEHFPRLIEELMAKTMEMERAADNMTVPIEPRERR